MKITSTFAPRDGNEWRAWLEANHARENEVWVVYYRPGGKQTGIDYETSVLEALCFGWVDSIIQKIGEERYARKFNPRRNGSNWSASNKKRMELLIAQGKMTPAGLAVFEPDAQESTSDYGQKIRRGEAPIPDETLQQMRAVPAAWQTYQKMAASRQRQVMSWILSAKKAETQQRRLAEVIETLAEGREVGLK